MNPLNRFPSIKQIATCYAVIVFLIFGWSFLAFIWKLNSWIYFLSAGEIIGVLAYTLLTDLAGSLMLLIILLILSFIFPSSFLRDQFAARGSVMVGMLTLWVYMFDHVFEFVDPAPRDMVAWGGLSLFSTIVFGYISGKIPYLSSKIVSVAERMTVFLYLWLPLSGAGILIVLGRLLF